MRRSGTTVKTTKKYPRVTAGPLRHQYVHRVVAGAMIGRDLKKDEEVDHKDGDRRNFHFSNLVIRGEKDHGWVSSKQAYFMRHRDAKEKKAWDKFMAEEEERQRKEISVARTRGNEWDGPRDGELRERYESEQT